MADDTPSVTFTPNGFYEILILLRNADPAALPRFAIATLAALHAYEAAKLKAKWEEIKRHRKQADVESDDEDARTPNIA